MEAEAEIVTDETGTTDPTGNVTVSELQAVYVPYGSVSEEGIASYRINLEANSGNAMVLQMKPESGNLVWSESSAKLSTSYGTVGTTNMRSIVNSLHDDNIYVVADISCFLDSAIASRNTALALVTGENQPYSDSYGSWLDPYSTEVQTYLSELVKELCNLGFDEIMLSNYCLPATGTMGDRTTTAPDTTTGDSSDTGDTTADSTVYYSHTQNPDAIAAVLSGLAEQLADITSAYHATLSIHCDSTILRDNLGVQTGQDLSSLKQWFRRITCDTDSEHLESDTAIIQSLLGDDYASYFVPITKSAQQDGNWIIR